jgi:hypothetical protein
VKLLLARQLGDIEASAMGLRGLNGTVILTERNKTVMTFLKDAYRRAKSASPSSTAPPTCPTCRSRSRRWASSRSQTKWSEAWDVRIRPNEPSAFQKLQERMKQALAAIGARLVESDQNLGISRCRLQERA